MKSDSNDNGTVTKKDNSVKKNSTLRKSLKWTGGIIGGLLLFIVVFATVVVWILTPERLTPLIEKYGSEFLIADVKLKKAELTFWSSFPKLEVDLKELNLISRSLDSIPPAVKRELPQYSDSLLSVRSFHGGVNILKLMIGKIALYDIDIDHPQVNLVVATSDAANFNIVPPSEKKDTTKAKIPDISINKFVIRNGAPVRYFSLTDSVNVAVNLNMIDFEDNGTPRYVLEVDGNTSASLAPYVDLAKLPIGLNGAIEWGNKNPKKIGFDDFRITAGPLKINVSTVLDATDDLTIESLKGKLEKFRLTDLVPYLPPNYRVECGKIESDLCLGADVEFTQPFIPSRQQSPSAKVNVKIPDGSLKYNEFNLQKLALDIHGDIDGRNLDKSVISLTKLNATIEGVSLFLKGSVTDILKDPLIDGEFKGGLQIARLPKALMQKLPVSVKGDIKGDFDFMFRLSYLTKEQFQRIMLNGDVVIKKLDVSQPEFGARLFSNFLELKLGANGSYIRNSFSCDSLLTASLKSDSIYVNLPGMTLTTRDMLLSAGTLSKVIETKGKGKKINPISALFKLGKLTFQATEDSMRVRLRDVTAKGALQMFENRSTVPLLTLSLDAGRMRYRDQLNRINFHETKIDVSCHPRLKPQMSRKETAVYDSLRARYPRLRPDSIYSLTQTEMQKMRRPRGNRSGQFNAGTENLDYGLDNSTKSLLKWMDFKARLTSKRARLFTPYFPVKNKLSNIDLTITSDSLQLRNTRYEMGHSDFLINGTISNISRALTTNRAPIKIRLNIASDTIDVNEIAEAAFAGAAFADKISQGAQVSLGDTENDELMQKVIEQTADGTPGPIVIPMNIDAALNIKANNIIYSNLVLDNFRGDALLYQGALNLHQLKAHSDMGSLSLSALYTAPTRNDLSFAFGLDIKDFYMEKVMQIIPAVDTLMPLLHDIKGIVNAEMAATTKVDTAMNIDIPSLSAALKITGDSLVLLDAETFRKIGKWMLFKNKDHNMIDHMEVQVVVQNSMLELFPFVFDIDRYKIGVMGSNDLALNLNYHVSVLKSPIPFKFGINVKGNPDKLKIRLGRAKFRDNMVVDRIRLVDTTRINLINQIEGVFRRGINNARVNRLKLQRPDNSALNGAEDSDTISAADSLIFIREGLLPAPPPKPEPVNEPVNGKKKDSRKNRKDKNV